MAQIEELERELNSNSSQLHYIHFCANTSGKFNCHLPKTFGSHEYWCLCNSALNNSKSSIPPLFTLFEALTSSTSKAECLFKF